MDEERVKSALEIAMERLSSMPELTEEEIAQQKEEQFRPVGQAIGRRYLTGMIGDKEMLEELGRHGAEPGSIVRSACVATLCASLQVADVRAAEKAMAGLSNLSDSPAAFRREADVLWNRFWSAYKKREEDTTRGVERGALEAMAAIGISGSALRPNLADNDSFQAALESVRGSFERDLEEFRSTLTEKISAERA